MISIRALKKVFSVKEGMVAALPGLDLEVAEKEFFVLLGPSGSGKSTLLRCVAGIERPDEGEIWLGGRLIFSDGERVFVRPEDRGLGMVFQSYAVWPHMTVFQNVALPLTHGPRRYTKAMVREKVMHALSLVQMESMADRPVPFLSGGQQQRVALARALAVEPVVLLMDEPLSNLDARLREEVRHEIREVTRSVGVTVLYVTHDQAEALALADRVAVMDHGRILQVGVPDDLYGKPTDATVAEFFGMMNWLTGAAGDQQGIKTPIGALTAARIPEGGALRVGIRPSDVQIAAAASGGENEFVGRVEDQVFLGEHVLLRVRLGEDTVLDVKAPKRIRDGWSGNEVWCRIDREDVLVFPAV